MFGRIDWKPSQRKLRSFAVSLLFAGLTFGLLLLAVGKETAAVYLIVPTVFLSTLSYALTPVGRIVYLLWMGVSYLLGRVFSPLVSAIIFYLVLTPAALIHRLVGRDNLRRRRSPDKTSYFSDHSDISKTEHFRRQF
jgi:hypothetical protein